MEIETVLGRFDGKLLATIKRDEGLVKTVVLDGNGNPVFAITEVQSGGGVITKSTDLKTGYTTEHFE